MKASLYPLVEAADALATVLDRTPVLEAEDVPLSECADRVPAADVVAPLELPAWRVSAVDGFAVRAGDGGKVLAMAGESAAGHPHRQRLPAGSAVRILTGAVLPEGADSVVMQEDASIEGDRVRVPGGIAPGANLHAPGDDIKRGEVVLKRGFPLGAAELGLAAALGLHRLRVHKRPRVALLSTGDELVELGAEPGPGQVYDSNRFALLAALREAGASVQSLGIAPDDAPELRRAVQLALTEAHVLVTSGGVSVGTHDLVKPLLESLGEVHIGRVKLKPGKPFTFATLPERRLAFGLPGFPVSSLVTFEVFVRPALLKMQGRASVQRPVLPVRLDYDARAPGDRTEYQRVTLAWRGDQLFAQSTGSQSSSRLLSMVGAHALVRIPPGSQGIAAGAAVPAIILSLP